MITSSQIASFVADMREHLQEEARDISSCAEGVSFSAGFAEGFSFWQKVYQAEDDFRYALQVLDKLVAPLDISIPSYRQISMTGSREETVAALLLEIADRDRELGVIQEKLLSLSPLDEKRLWSADVRQEFEDSFWAGLQDLLG